MHFDKVRVNLADGSKGFSGRIGLLRSDRFGTLIAGFGRIQSCSETRLTSSSRRPYYGNRDLETIRSLASSVARSHRVLSYKGTMSDK